MYTHLYAHDNFAQKRLHIIKGGLNEVTTSFFFSFFSQLIFYANGMTYKVFYCDYFPLLSISLPKL